MAALASSAGPVTSYSNIALAGSGKKGILKKLDNNYYEIIIGAFGAFGNGGWLYDTRTAMRYLENDREFLEMLQNGRLRGEWGHPVRPTGMSDRDWFVRINTVLESNISTHFRKIRTSLDTVKDERGRAVVAIIAEASPDGPHIQATQRMFDNPDADMNYSIRCFAAKNMATMTKHINRIVTWDLVVDPGIAVASKYKTPSLECKTTVASMLDEAEFNLMRIRQGLAHSDGVNDESFEAMSPYIKIIDSMTEASNIQVAMPKSLQW